ncbi:MAG: 3-keto-5-aminohexanoate cleavage protein [Salinarimonas sp.]|nr:3-keto-5-aminohexanoate cleavage protein [Salinarimonas sp.]
MIDDTIIAVAPNGGRRTTADHPALPVTVEDTARTAAECCEMGAAMLHVHVRRPDQRHSLDVDLYRDVTAAVRREAGPDMVIQATTESVGLYGPDEQMAMVRALRPEAISMALRELAPDEDHKARFSEFTAWLQRENIAGQIILYDRDDTARARAWAQEGVFDPAAMSVIFVTGKYTPPTTAMPIDLLPLFNDCADVFRDWMLCAFGPRETGCMTLAALLGGHCRVGFENNLALPDGERAPDNAAIVAATVNALDSVGLAAATPAQLRARWGL